MALMPKRVKYRKSQRGKLKGNATRGNRVVFGDFALQALQGGWISAQTIEAAIRFQETRDYIRFIYEIFSTYRSLYSPES